MQNKNKEEFGDRYIITDYVVTGDLGVLINPGYLSNIFTKFIRLNGLKHITLHGLRHTMASVGNDEGLTLYEISKILGHCDTAITSEILKVALTLTDNSFYCIKKTERRSKFK